MTKMRKLITSALAATMLVGSISVATPAAAWGRFGYGGGWARPGFGHYGWGGGWGGGWRRGWGGGWGYGGTAAAGLLGGLALGTVAAASPWGYGGYGYPYGGYGYYGAAYPSYGYGGGCSCW